MIHLCDRNTSTNTVFDKSLYTKMLTKLVLLRTGSNSLLLIWHCGTVSRMQESLANAR